MKYTATVLALGLSLLTVTAAGAQSFGSGSEAAAAPKVKAVKLSPEDNRNNEPQQSIGGLPSPQPLAGATRDENAEFFVPKGALGSYSILERPTEDRSERGNVAIYQINDRGFKEPVSKIFLYYDKFKISRSIGGLTTCDVRFYVNTNLDRKLVSLDLKLVWPGITTALSFSGVDPNTPTYFDYTLMGDGCYNMAKMPNIVVSRCRVRGLSSAECAAKITWLKSVK